MKVKKTIAGICALAMLGTCGMTAFAEEVTTTNTETPAETTVTTEASATMTEGTTDTSVTTEVTTEETTTVETAETAVVMVEGTTDTTTEETIEATTTTIPEEFKSLLDYFKEQIGSYPDNYAEVTSYEGNVVEAYMYLDGKEYFVTTDGIEEVAPFEPEFNTEEEKNLYDMFVTETGYKPSYYTFETAEDGSLIGHMYYYFDENGISYEIEGIVTSNGIEYLDTHKTESGLMSELYNIMDEYFNHVLLFNGHISLDWNDNYVMSSDGELQGYLHYYFIADNGNTYHSVYLATLDGNVSELYTVLYDGNGESGCAAIYDELYNSFLENCVDENTTKYEIISTYEDIIIVDGEEVTVETLIAQVWKGSEIFTYSITKNGIELIEPKKEPIHEEDDNNNTSSAKKNPAGTGNSPKTGDNTVLPVALALTFVAGTAVVASVKRFKK